MAGIDLQCGGCGKSVHLTDEYLRQYADLRLDCECGASMVVPAAEMQVPVEAGPPQLGYAAPQYPPPAVGPGVWRDGKFVVVQRGAKLPMRCCQCNEPVEAVQTIRFKWIPPQHRATFGGVVGLAQSAIADSYSTSLIVDIGRCRRHQGMSTVKLIAIFLMVGGVAAIVSAGVLLEGPKMPWGVAVGAVSIVAGWILLAFAPAIEIDEYRSDCFWLRGFGKDYAQALPDLATDHAQETAEQAHDLDQIQD